MANPSPISDTDIRTILQGIQAPYMDIDLVAAGMVRDIELRDGKAAFTLAFPVPMAESSDSLVREIKAALTDALPGLEDIGISVITDIPGRIGGQGTGPLAGVKNTIAISSGKGGVGKSTVAVNMAVALAKAGARVGLIDADIYGPSIPLMMNVTSQPQAYSENGKTRLLPSENYGVKLMSIGFLVRPEDAVIWRGPMASGALKQFLTDVDWGELDYLLFDMPPGTGDIQLTLSQTLPLSGAVIVTTPQDIALADARKGFAMFEKVSVPILGVVENMSFHQCSNCGHRDDIFDSGGGRRTADELHIPLLGEIPIATRIREGGDKGIPIVELEPENPVAQSMTQTALNMAGRVSARTLSSPGDAGIDISL